ncbi:hypothetical protein CCS92_30335 [Methylobacterium radiotolerans]|nr:hypothetical protein CCS92_30335 [Methylobacterium radiotolerans]
MPRRVVCVRWRAGCIGVHAGRVSECGSMVRNGTGVVLQDLAGAASAVDRALAKVLATEVGF